MSLSLANNFSKNHPTGKGQRLSDFCAKHSTHQCRPCGRSTFGIWHYPQAKYANWHVFQARPEQGGYMVFHIFLSKCNPLVLCAASTHNALEMKPSALLVPLLKGLESCIHGSGSREANPKPDLDTG